MNTKQKHGEIKFVRSLIALAIVGAFAPTAKAQESTPATSPTMAAQAPSAKPAEEKPTPESMQELVVVGTRASLQSAISRKKDSGTVVDSIVAEDIASFPDKNIGEALQRITGVQLTRDYGEGTQVSIRGVEPDLNRVEIDGMSLLGNSGTGSRGADFRELAAELVKSIDVFKGFTADMTEGGVGGTVSIQTRKPLELRKPMFVVTGSGQYLDTAEEFKPRANLTVGDTFFGKRFGALLNVTYDDNITRGDFMRGTEWQRIADLDSNLKPTDKTVADPLYDQYSTFASCSAITTAANRTACQTQFYDYTPNPTRYSINERYDNRISGQLTLQYRFSEELDVYATGNYNLRDNRLIDNHYVIDTGAATRYQPGSALTDDDHNVVSFMTATGLGTGQARDIVALQSRDFSYKQDSSYYSSGFTWHASDDVELTGMYGTSKATTINNTNFAGVTASVPGIRVSIDPNSGVPSFIFPLGYNAYDSSLFLNNPNPSNGPTISYRPGWVRTNEDQAKWDLDWTTDWPFLNKIETGVQYRSSGTLSYNGGGRNETNGAVIPSANAGANVTLGVADANLNSNAPVWSTARYQQYLNAVMRPTSGTFYNTSGVDRTYLPDSWMAPGFNTDTTGQYFDLSGFDHDLLFEAPATDAAHLGQVYRQAPQFNITETINAVYLKGNFATRIAGMRLTGNFGGRYVSTKDVATGSNTITEIRSAPTPANPDATSTVIVGTQIVDIDNRYSDFLPSINVNLEVFKNFYQRLGWAKVLARPKPTDLVPNASCTYDLTPTGVSDGDADDCSAGNPDLKPYEADQYDYNIGWYPDRDTLLSAGLFYKDITSFILQRTLVPNVDLFNDGRLFDVRQPINGAGAKVYGAELSAQTAFTFLPSPFNGFGGIANYTYTTAKDVGLFNQLNGEKLSFPGMSKHSYNLTLYYDKGPANVRLSWNARGKYLSSAADRGGNPVYTDATGYLDGKATFRVQKTGWSFFVEGKNLTGEEQRTSSGGMRLGALSYAGRRYFAGFTYKY